MEPVKKFFSRNKVSTPYWSVNKHMFRKTASASSPKLDRPKIQDGSVPVNLFEPMPNIVNLVKLTSEDGRVETREFLKSLMCSVRYG